MSAPEAVEIVARAIRAAFGAGDQPKYTTVEDWHPEASAVLAALSSAGLLATEQEWGVHMGDADLPDGSINTYSSRERATSQREYIGGTVVSRRVTTWRDA